jgi:hypothetical protein
MPRRSTPARPPWEDRFSTPTPETLLGAIAPDRAPLAERIREHLSQTAGLTERLEWCGLPWRWALTYRAESDDQPQAYLVPNPEAPSVVFRLSHEQFEALPVRKLSRHIRDGLAPARLVAGVCWPEWTFQSANQASDLLALFDTLAESSLTKA